MEVLGAAEMLGAAERLGALDTKRPSEGASVGPLERQMHAGVHPGVGSPVVKNDWRQGSVRGDLVAVLHHRPEQIVVVAVNGGGYHHAVRAGQEVVELVVARGEALGVLLGACVGPVLMEGAVEVLGAAEMLGAVERLSSLTPKDPVRARRWARLRCWAPRPAPPSAVRSQRVPPRCWERRRCWGRWTH